MFFKFDFYRGKFSYKLDSLREEAFRIASSLVMVWCLLIAKFQLFRLSYLITFHDKISAPISSAEYLKVITHGFSFDAALSGRVCILIFLFSMVFSSFSGAKTARYFYNFIVKSTFFIIFYLCFFAFFYIEEYGFREKIFLTNGLKKSKGNDL